GPQVLTATLKAADAEFDNTQDAIVDVLEPLDVLIISGDEREGRWSSESDLLRLALAPFEALKRKGTDLARVRIAESSGLAEAEPGRFDVIILANVPQLSDA